MFIISEENILDLLIDKQSILTDLDEIEAKRQQVSRAVEQTGAQTAATFGMAVNVVSTTYDMISRLLNFAGVATNTTLDTIADAFFESLNVLIPLASTYAALGTISPAHAVAAGVAFGNIAIGTIAALSTQDNAKDIAARINEASQSVSGITDWMGGFYFMG